MARPHLSEGNTVNITDPAGSTSKYIVRDVRPDIVYIYPEGHPDQSNGIVWVNGVWKVHGAEHLNYQVDATRDQPPPQANIIYHERLFTVSNVDDDLDWPRRYFGSREDAVEFILYLLEMAYGDYDWPIDERTHDRFLVDYLIDILLEYGIDTDDKFALLSDKVRDWLQTHDTLREFTEYGEGIYIDINPLTVRTVTRTGLGTKSAAKR